MSTLKLISLILALFVLAVGLVFLSMLFTGAGHGTVFFLLILVSPFSVFGESQWIAFASMALWIAFAFSLFFLRFAAVRLSIMAALLAHYIGVVIICFRTAQTEEWHYVSKVWGSATLFVLLFIAGYLLLQYLLWLPVTRRYDAP